MDKCAEDELFVQFRRKLRSNEVLSGSVEKMLREMHFNGKISVTIKNGSLMRSFYEEQQERR